jgi:hypothetical protein
MMLRASFAQDNQSDARAALTLLDAVHGCFARKRTFTDRSISAADDIETSRSPGLLHRTTRIQP